MSRLDRLMVYELAERPPSIAPPLPDVEAPASTYWLGGCGAEVQRWRERALRAEKIVEEMQPKLAATKPPKPPTST